MKNEKSSFGKRIAAIVASILLLFAKSSEATIASPAETLKLPAVTNEMTFKDSQNFYRIGRYYGDFKAIAEETIPLENILSTSVGEETCDTMVPQGLAILDDMILVTAYDGIDGYKNELRLHSYKKEYTDKLESEEGHKPHNSVIYVLDRKTKEIIVTLELPDINHVGGITVDDNYAYIAKSLEKNISVISLDKLRRIVENVKLQERKTAKIFYDKTLECNCDASFVSMREDENGKKQMVIGTWNPLPNSSVIRIFDFNESGELELNQRIRVNSSANGAKFVRRDGEEYLLVSCSLGRALDSKLIVYKTSKDEEGKLKIDEKSRFTLPPMLEEIEETTDEEGKRKLVIGTEIFSNRYEIGRQKVFPTGLIVADLDLVLDRDGKKTKDQEKPIVGDALEIDPVRKEYEDEEVR